MFNAKWGIICGGAAFVLAFITSLLLGHTSLSAALIRGGGFAALFFGLGAGIWALINIFIPELLAAQNDDVNNVFSKKATGARVNITLDDTSNSAFSAALPSTGIGLMDDDEEVGDFKDLISRSTNSRRDIDQNPAAGYTEQEEQQEEQQQEEFTPVFDSSLDTSLGGSIENSLDGVKVDGLGDFSMDFGAFVPEGGGGSDPLMDPFSFMPGTDDSAGAEETHTAAAAPRSSSSGKPAELQGDFNPKDIAAGIRTVLEKDKKG